MKAPFIITFKGHPVRLIPGRGYEVVSREQATQFLGVFAAGLAAERAGINWRDYDIQPLTTDNKQPTSAKP